jgi:murein DD-endopeptidase MepM/ murein hydrolase activator NlpD
LRKRIAFFLFIWVFTSLACNFPTVAKKTPAATPIVLPGASGGLPDAPTPAVFPVEGGNYTAQSGDTMAALALRFDVSPDQITSAQPIPTQGFIPAGQVLTIPSAPADTLDARPLLPDAEVVNSPTARDFDIQSAVSEAGGYLSSYTQQVDSERLTGVQIVQHVADLTSVNPRLLLAFIEYRTGWLTTRPANPDLSHPLAFDVPEYQGLYLELSLAAKLLNIGYYGWQQGTRTTVTFSGGGSARLAPQINAGTAALQYLFARLYAQTEWQAQLYGESGFLARYEALFPDPWARAASAGPIFPAEMPSPTLELPFAAGERWSLTAGPHVDWNTGTPAGALDFAPITGEPACAVSSAWVRASAPGIVVRTGSGTLLLDLDGDGSEQTGWVLLYMHIAQRDRLSVGARVQTGDPLGHPSCEGGDATGTHIHIARKYNGEWIGADASLLFILSGWTAYPGEQAYDGTLVKDDQVVTAHPDGSHGSTIVR